VADLGPAVFRDGPFSVTVAEHHYLFRHEPAATWARALFASSWILQVLHLMDPESYEEMLDRIQEGSVSQEHVRRIAHAALADAGGRPWWEVERLVRACGSNDGRLLGRVVLAGVDPARVTLAAFCAAVWAAATEGAGPEDMLKMESMLTVPPPDALAEEAVPVENPDEVVARLRQLPGVRLG